MKTTFPMVLVLMAVVLLLLLVGTQAIVQGQETQPAPQMAIEVPSNPPPSYAPYPLPEVFRNLTEIRHLDDPGLIDRLTLYEVYQQRVELVQMNIRLDQINTNLGRIANAAEIQADAADRAARAQERLADFYTSPPPPAAGVVGDLNGDGVVNLTDLRILQELLAQ